MKPKLYLETTIPSYLVARPSRDLVIAANQQITHEWWDSRRADFELYVSEFVVREVGAGDQDIAQARLKLIEGMPVLEADASVKALAAAIVNEGPVPEKAAVDAGHIAIAAYHSCEFLLTWNCRHIANPEIETMLRRIVARHGLELPVLCTPFDLMGGRYV